MIDKIKLENFRRFDCLEIDTKYPIVILSGPNATGKTTLLEAIYVASTAKSHRTNDIQSLITTHASFAKLTVQSEKEFQVIISKEGKKNYINRVEYPKLSDFIGHLQVVMFSPSDLDLVNGSRGHRRKFLDLEISLLDKTYLRNLMTYKKILKERNEILKEYTSDKKTVLKIITDQLIEMSRWLYQKRIDFLSLLNEQLKMIRNKLECEEILLEYEASFDPTNMEKSFDVKLKYDLFSKTTNIGIHRDDFKIFIHQQDALEYASEGQKRTIILAMKLALKEVYEKVLKVQPILLLDDVFAALDQKRINHIMKYIKLQNQTFITTTSIFSIPDELLKDAKVIRL